MDALTAIKTRRSIRKFKNDPVSKEDIEKIVDAGRMAATANNAQKWEFIVVTNAGMRKKIKDECPKNGPYIEFAPVCIATYSEAGYKHAPEDCGAATQNMCLAATSLGLGSVWIAGWQKEYSEPIKKLLGIPENFELMSLLAIGYPDESPTVPKRNLEEVLHWEKW